MKRIALIVLMIGGALLAGPEASAEDIVYVRDAGQKGDVSQRGTIVSESPSGVKLRTSSGVKTIPTERIAQIDYGSSAVDAISFRKPDNDLRKARGQSAKRRTELLQSALTGFQNLDAQLRGTANIHRYLQYRIAQTTAELGRDDAKQRDAAIALLIDYRGQFADGWEIVPALTLLAGLQEDKGDAAGASDTYAALAEVPGIAETVKWQSHLRAARLLVRGRKFTQAETKLKLLASSLPKDDPQRAFVDVYLIQVRLERGNLDGIEAKLKAVLRGSENKELRALVHNALGDYYRHKEDADSAFWQYLFVDTSYSENKEEHAKALYYLWKLFNNPRRNDPTRAEECLAKLTSAEFDGTVYQRMARNEKKKR